MYDAAAAGGTYWLVKYRNTPAIRARGLASLLIILWANVLTMATPFVDIVGQGNLHLSVHLFRILVAFSHPMSLLLLLIQKTSIATPL